MPRSLLARLPVVLLRPVLPIGSAGPLVIFSLVLACPDLAAGAPGYTYRPQAAWLQAAQLRPSQRREHAPESLTSIMIPEASVGVENACCQMSTAKADLAFHMVFSQLFLVPLVGYGYSTKTILRLPPRKVTSISTSLS